MGKFIRPRGTRDFLPGTMEIRDNVIKSIEKIFREYGFHKWDGPAFEHLKTLTRKSGAEVEKEIFVFKDKSGRDLGLRFELTASIARMIADNSYSTKMPIKGYSVGKVWRYENPQFGRYREFLQMDADIFGSRYMVCEVEILGMANRVLGALGFKDFHISLNNRKVLEAQFRCSGIPEKKKIAVFRSLDKLNKIGKKGVQKEFIRGGLSQQNFEDLIGYLVTEETNRENIRVMSDLLSNDKKGIEGLREISEILDLTDGIEGLGRRIKVDYTLVRGLDYYTGPIFEILTTENRQMGSIAGGGRYDQLVELYGGDSTPAVGIGFGIERIADLIENNPEMSVAHSHRQPSIFVIYVKLTLLKHTLGMVEKLRDSGIQADFDLLGRSFKNQLSYANKMKYRFVLFIGDNEIREDRFTLKDMETGLQERVELKDIIGKLSRLHES